MGTKAISNFKLLYEGTEVGSDGKFLVAERFQWKANNAKITKLKQEGRIPLHAKAPEATSDPVPSETEETNVIAETQLDETSQDADMTAEGGAKRSVDPGTSPQKKRTKVQPLPPGVTRVENEGKGNCLFWAIAQSIQSSRGGVHHHRSVRAAAVTHFRKHLEKYSMFWDNKNTNNEIMEKKGIDGFKDYVEEVSTIGNWAGNLEIAALATTLDRPILLIHECGQIYIFNPEGSKPDLLSLLPDLWTLRKPAGF